MKITRYIANTDSAQGYGYIATRLLDGLVHAGATLLPVDAYDWDLLVAVTPPRPWITGPDHRSDIVMHTMFDMEPVPDSWVRILNKVGLVWVPSQSSKDMFCRAGVTTPIFVSGYALDDVFSIVDRRGRSADDVYRVLVWGDSFATRKNVLRSVSVFLQAELPHACIDVKIYDPSLSADDILVEGAHDDRITLYNEKWTPRALASWLHTGDIGIYLSSGEGFGLMPFQMMGTGLPVLLPIHTGMAEYATPDCVIDVPYTDKYVCPSFTTQFNQTMYGYEPDWDRATEKLIQAYYHRDEAYQIGMKGAQAVRKETWESVGKRAFAFLSSYLSTGCIA